ncbi:MAG: hypothetical protein IPG64_23405 [Haliea sp.]|nr:hypothetical protein [Haliea sp.]
MGFIKALLIFLVIPIFGYGVCFGFWATLTNRLLKAVYKQHITELCVPEVLAEQPNLRNLCSEVAPIVLMQKASIVIRLCRHRNVIVVCCLFSNGREESSKNFSHFSSPWYLLAL